MSTEKKQAQAHLLMMKGAMSEMTEAERTKINEVAAAIRALVKDNGDEGLVAIAIVGLEIQAQ